MHAKIPQSNGIYLPIMTHQVEDAVKTLGFCHTLGASKINHVKLMIKKGTDWVDRMSTGKLLRRGVWMTFFAQLLQGITWGLVTIVFTPTALQQY